MRSNIIYLIIILISLYCVNFITNGAILKKVFKYKTINKIELINITNISRVNFLEEISVREGQSFWLFNPFKLKEELNNIIEIKNFSFKLNWNGVLEISIEEKKPFMKWIIGNKERLIDEQGNTLNMGIRDKNMKFIKLYGKGANFNIDSIWEVLSNKKDIYVNIKSIIFQKNIGWQINFNDNNCVLIPLKKLDKVFHIFQNIQNSSLYDKFNFFDLRIIGRVYMSKKEC